MVFDGVEDAGLLRPFIPAAGAARVLLIVASEPMAELGTVVTVDVFSADEALALLDGRTGLADEAGASAVASEPGRLPQQAAAGCGGAAAVLHPPAGCKHLAWTDDAWVVDSTPGRVRPVQGDREAV